MIGFILAFFLLALALGIPAYAVSTVFRARRQRRRQLRLETAYARAVHARKHGLPPIWAGAGLLSRRQLRPVEIR